MNRITLFIVFHLFKCVISRGPPTLWANASNFVTLEINENQSIDIQCPVVHTPDLSIQWSKNNEDLDPMWSDGNLLIKRLALKIQNAQFTDAGLYKCHVVNGFGNVQAQFHVKIKANKTASSSLTTDEPESPIAWDVDSFSGEAPEFVSRNDDNQLGPTTVIQPEGTTVQFKCLASGKPLPEIRWKKNGKILSEDEYGVTQSQILIIKDLVHSDTGNYTCEVFNSFGAINSTFVLLVTEKLQFFGSDPHNNSVQMGQPAALHCRVQTKEPTIKIQWFKKLDSQQAFRPDAIVFDSEQYEFIEQSREHLSDFSNNILSKSLIFQRVANRDHGQYICLIQKDKISNYKKVFLQVTNVQQGLLTSTHGYENNLLYVMIVPLCFLGLIVFIIFCIRHRRRKSNRRHHTHSNCSDSIKSSMKTRQPFIHPPGAVMPSTTITRTSNDYIAASVDSIPITRQYQQRYGLPLPSDLASLTSSNLYYARVQAI